jgi:hypothetical protein
MLNFKGYLTETDMSLKELNKHRNDFIEAVRANALKTKDNTDIVLLDPKGFADDLETISDDDFKKKYVGKFIIPTTVGDIKFSDISKTNTLQTGSDTIRNRGDVAEGIFAAALFARFNNRTPTGIAPITNADVVKVINRIGKVAKLTKKGKRTFMHASISSKVNDVNPISKDITTLSIGLAPSNFSDFINKAPAKMAKEISSAVAYANSSNVSRYAKFLYVNNKPNKLVVDADGISNQTGTKVDVYVTIDRRRTNLNVSLKVSGGDQFGQVGGSDFIKLVDFFKILGVDISAVEHEFANARVNQGVDASIDIAYAEGFKLLRNVFAGGPKKDVAAFNKFVKGVMHFATLGDPTVRLVSLERGTFKEFSFKKFDTRLATTDVEVISKGTRRPTLVIRNATDGKELFILRSKYEKSEDYYRNLISKGSGLSSLLSRRTL